MERKVKRIKVFAFLGEAPRDLSGMDPDFDILFNEAGEKVSCTQDWCTTEFVYDKDSRLIEERSADESMIYRKTYEYDPEGELFHILARWKEYFNDGGDSSVQEGLPDNKPSVTGVGIHQGGTDEWFTWSEDGRVRTRVIEIHMEDGATVRKKTTEEYSPEGSLTAIRHPEDEHGCTMEERFYRDAPDNLLRVHEYLYLFRDAKGNVRRSVTKSWFSDSDERVVSELNSDFDDKGEAIQRESQFLYEDNAEGDWTRCTEISGGEILREKIRQIEYW